MGKEDPEDLQRQIDERKFQQLEDTIPRWRQARVEWLERGFRYLLAVHSGGLVAGIAFVGALVPIRPSLLVLIALATFAAGLFLCGVLILLRFYNASREEQRHKREYRSYFDEETMSFSLPPASVVYMHEPPTNWEISILNIMVVVIFLLFWGGLVVGSIGILDTMVLPCNLESLTSDNTPSS